MSWTMFVLTVFFTGTLPGFLTALEADWAFFKKADSWRSFSEFDFSVASWRWFKGAVIGTVTSGAMVNFLPMLASALGVKG